MTLRGLSFLLLAILLVAALPASAQGEDCDDAGDACPLVIEVDAAGFVGETLWIRTVDEWANITVANDDEAPHTVTIAGYGVSLTVPEYDDDSTTILLETTGDFEVKDQTTGKTATLRVVAEDSEQQGSSGAAGGSGTTKGSPGVGAIGLVVAAGVALVAARRTR